MKGGLTFDERRRRLYFGDYGGRVHAIRSRNGQRVWTAKTRSGPLGLGRGSFYSTPARRLRAGLHRQHKRQRLLVRRGHGPSRLAQAHRQLRVLLARGRARASRATDRLRRVLRRQALRPGRAHRTRPLEPPRRGPDLGQPGRHRRARLVLDARQDHRCRGGPDRPPGLPDAPRRLQPRGLGRALRLSRRATRACSRCSRATRRAPRSAGRCWPPSAAGERARRTPSPSHPSASHPRPTGRFARRCGSTRSDGDSRRC